jgi:hypothetical protein
VIKRPTPGYIANFDSASAMLRATARFLHGKDFPPMGLPPLLKPLMRGANLLARRPREEVYALGGLGEAISPKRLNRVSAERLSAWAASRYPDRRYPAVMVGSSNGAAVHLCTALGIPWLPQTLLIPVRRSGIHPDDMLHDMEWGREPARRLLDANPELQLHHMHDPNQDRLMIEYMTYFRVKRLSLGKGYERFIRESLEPGGTIFLLECEARWPAKWMGERHLFQPGAMGGLEPEEYLYGSPRVEEYLAHYGSHRRRWEAPQPDGEFPEAEWGFEPALRDDVERFAEDHGFDVVRVGFELPEDLSPLVADLYRWWYRKRRIVANRLVASSFLTMEPWWTMRTGSVPFWCKFPVEPSADALESYLDGSDPFDEIGVMLFSHGTESAGLAPISRWRSLMERATEKGYFIGVDEEKFPLDFATFARYHDEIQKIPARYPMPGPLTLGQLEDFLEREGHRYDVRWRGPTRTRVGVATAAV